MMNTPDSATIQRQAAARRAAWQPFGIAVLVVAVLAAATLLLASGNIGVVTNTFVVVLCLLPLLVIALALVMAVALGIWAAGKADKAAVRALIKAEAATQTAKVKAQEGSVSIGKRFIGVASAVERLAPLWDIFDIKKKRGRGDDAQPEPPVNP